MKQRTRVQKSIDVRKGSAKRHAQKQAFHVAAAYSAQPVKLYSRFGGRPALDQGAGYLVKKHGPKAVVSKIRPRDVAYTGKKPGYEVYNLHDHKNPGKLFFYDEQLKPVPNLDMDRKELKAVRKQSMKDLRARKKRKK